jgi:hypothetical protein
MLVSWKIVDFALYFFVMLLLLKYMPDLHKLPVPDGTWPSRTQKQM